MISSSTGRFLQPKIEFDCSCGKRYRVAPDKAGKKVRCKRCKAKVRVPGDAAISMRTRRAILEEVGIDAEAAERAYEDEQRQGYVCTLCAGKLAEDALQAAYGEEGLMCSTCRAAQVSERGSAKHGDEKRKAKLDRWTGPQSLARVQKKALALAALVFVGITGLLASVFGLTLWIAAPAAAALAYLARRTVLESEYVPDDE